MPETKEKNKEPTEWKPIDIEKFNKSAKELSGLFTSDPERISKIEECEKGDS